MRKRRSDGVVVRSARQWARIVERWRHGGQRAAEFCHGRGLNLKTFQWWRWAVKKRSLAVAYGAGVARPVSGRGLLTGPDVASGPPVPAFVEVVSAGLRQSLSPVIRQDSGVAILIERVHTRRQVRVEPDFDATTLRRVVQVLEEV